MRENKLLLHAFLLLLSLTAYAHADRVNVSWVATGPPPVGTTGFISSFSFNMDSTFISYQPGTAPAGALPFFQGTGNQTDCMINGSAGGCGLFLDSDDPFPGIEVGSFLFGSPRLWSSFQPLNDFFGLYTLKAPLTASAGEVSPFNLSVGEPGILTITPTPAPEPASFIYLLTGGAAAFGASRRRRLASRAA